MTREQLDSMSEVEIQEYLKDRKQKPYEDALKTLQENATEIGRVHGNKPVRRVLQDCAERCPKSR
jgi:hypothetical protein